MKAGDGTGDWSVDMATAPPAPGSYSPSHNPFLVLATNPHTPISPLERHLHKGDGHLQLMPYQCFNQKVLGENVVISTRINHEESHGQVIPYVTSQLTYLKTISLHYKHKIPNRTNELSQILWLNQYGILTWS